MTPGTGPISHTSHSQTWTGSAETGAVDNSVSEGMLVLNPELRNVANSSRACMQLWRRAANCSREALSSLKALLMPGNHVETAIVLFSQLDVLCNVLRLQQP